ncbi:hypothetical protein P154DRAFT_623767 [Amniculicola lignicola CBS 123094]|uniref:Rhodopsin domain-containing protein n=1 Tax=Amniculicola lignicola CBS 123094 TaxID=1392246 RepID=A0A6A5W1T9_9PLEO|nr:hypothetical protein P154DRAFT_623767 [Amniculicola lignicola CBS 123094]
MDSPQGIMAHPVDASPVPPALPILAVLCLLLVLPAVGARTFVKIKDSKHLRLEDCSILVAVFGLVVYIIVLFPACSAGISAHTWDVSQSALKDALLLSNALSIIFAIVALSAKLAVLLQIAQIRTESQRTLGQWLVWSMISLNTLGYLSIFLVNTVACTPRLKISNPTINGQCISHRPFTIATASIDTASDIATLLLAIFVMRNLQLSFHNRIKVSGMLGVGIVACVASGFKLYYSEGLDADFTAAMWPIHLWALPELTFIIVTACLPVIPRWIMYIRRGNIRPPAPKHSQWVSASKHPSRTKIFYPTDTATTLSIPTPKSPRSEVPGEALTDVMLVHSRPVSPFEPFSRPISYPDRPDSYANRPESYLSRLSYASFLSATVATYSQQEAPGSPISQATSTTSTPQLRHATEICLTPIRFGTIRRSNDAAIRKTTDLRVSTHTNPGSLLGVQNDQQW